MVHWVVWVFTYQLPVSSSLFLFPSRRGRLVLVREGQDHSNFYLTSLAEEGDGLLTTHSRYSRVTPALREIFVPEYNLERTVHGGRERQPR